MHTKYEPLVPGQAFHCLTVIAPKHCRDKKGAWLALLRCRCGAEVVTLPCHIQSGRRKSCGCYRRQLHADRLKQIHEFKRSSPGSRAAKVLYTRYRHAAKLRGLAFELLREDFMSLVAQPCSYCGNPPSNVQSYRDYRIADKFYEEIKYSGIDRVNNEAGYVLGNCTPCCSTCNLAKRDMSRDQFLNWVKKVYTNAFITL